MSPEAKRITRWAVLIAVLGVGLAAVWLVGLGGERVLVTREAPQDVGRGYDVTLEPAGKVHFTHVPRKVMTLDANYNDMLVTIDHEQRLIATGYQGNFFEGFYTQVREAVARPQPGGPGFEVALDTSTLKFVGMGGIDKETLYALGAEVHHIDPIQLTNGGRWKPSDIEEISRNVGPFLANRYSRENSHPGDLPYRFYTLWELSEKIGEVYQSTGPVIGLKAIYEEMVRDIQARLPPVKERPSVGLVMYQRERFTPFNLSRQGFGTAHYRAVGAQDAFLSIQHLTYADSGGAANLDVEGLLALDPDILIMPFAVYPSYKARFDELLALERDPLVARLKAYRNRRVYPGGTPLQGPIFLLFQTEMTAKQIYPQIFGPFRPDHVYPESERLFDRARVAKVLGPT